MLHHRTSLEPWLQTQHLLQNCNQHLQADKQSTKAAILFNTYCSCQERLREEVHTPAQLSVCKSMRLLSETD